ncbi:MAG: SDR family oxidoreductase [Anaerolineales bacterium]|jgi:NAD(P)-dependent dehydrogenase (short-subunit alcohol dehydrogenase family)
MDSGLQGKTALVTGGGSGIGRAIALALATEGVDVAIVSRDPNPQTVKQIEALGVSSLRLCRDLQEETQVISMVQETILKFGHLDLFVNNAAWTWHEPVTRIATESWVNTHQINVLACVWACREVCKHMVARRQGSILIVGSTAQYNPAYKEAAYHASKAALASYMATLAVEMGLYKIRVNMLVPGSFPTKLNPVSKEKEEKIIREVPLRRLGVPEECGPTAILLLSDKLSAYTTGAEVVVSGGLHLRPFGRYTDKEIFAMNVLGE